MPKTYFTKKNLGGMMRESLEPIRPCAPKNSGGNNVPPSATQKANKWINKNTDKREKGRGKEPGRLPGGGNA